MISFKEFIDTQSISESFINLFVSDQEKRQLLVDEVWKILQDSYAGIGGIHGTGFNSKQDMIDSIPFWKLVRKNGDIVTVVMYKEKDGRKLVACGTNGSEAGKLGLLDILTNDLKRDRGYVEMSDTLLKFLVRNIGYDLIKKNVKTYQEAEKILAPDTISQPDQSDPELVLHPQLKQYFYRREIGGNLHTKIMFGKTGKTVVDLNL